MPVDYLSTPEQEDSKEDQHSATVDAGFIQNLVAHSATVLDSGAYVTATVKNALRTRSAKTLKAIHSVRIRRLIASLPSPKEVIELNDEVWLSLLSKSIDLCYLSLSGRFNRKDGYHIKVPNGVIPIESAFRRIPPAQHIAGAYPFTVFNGEIIAFSPSFAPSAVRSAIEEAIGEGQYFCGDLPTSHYENLSLSGGSGLSAGFGPPFGKSFSQTVVQFMQELHIDSAEFMRRTHLDYNIFSNLKNRIHYQPEKNTCKAILFAVEPNVLAAIYLYGLAGHYFQNTDDDLLLLAFFANEDYSIDKYNEVIIQRGGTPLGSKNYKKA